MKKLILTLAVLSIIVFNGFGQTTYYSIANGDWNDGNNWSLTPGGVAAGAFPGNLDNDIAVIRDGFTIFYIVGAGGNASETIGELILGQASTDGTLVYFHANDGAIDDNYTLVVTGDVTITNTTSSGIQTGEAGDIINGQTVPGSGFEDNTHELQIGGNLNLDAGIFDLESPNGGSTNLVFNGSGNQEITESGAPTVEVASTITFSNIGTAPNNEIRVSSNDFSNGISANCTFTAGTFVHNNDGSFVNNSGNTAYTLTTAFDIEILDGEFTLTTLTNDQDQTIQGSLTISGDGIFNVSTDGDGGTEDAANMILEGTLNLSGTGVLNVSSETGFPTTPANGADDGTLTIEAASTVSITGGTVFTEVLVLNRDVAFDGATIYVGDDDGIAGSITLAAGVDVDMDDCTFTFVGDDIFMNDNTTFEINNVSGTGGTYTIADDVNANTVINMTGANASFLVNTGTVNIAQNTGVEPIFSLTGAGASITVNSGGVLDIYGTPNADDDIGITIGGANQTITVNGGDLNIGNTTDNAGRLSYNASATNFNLNISNGGDVIIGEDFTDGNTAALTSTVTITGATSSLTIGDLADFDDLSLTDGTLTVESEDAVGLNVDIRGTATLNSGTTTFADGLFIASTGSLVLSSGTLNIETTATALTDTRFNLDGNFTQNGGTFNFATAATSKTGGNLIYIDDEVIFRVNEGTFNALANLTDGNNLTGGNGILIDDTDNQGGGDDGDSDLIIGDGSGSAVVNIAANMGAATTVTNVDLLEVQGPNATITIDTDGTLNLGASSTNTNSNMGRLFMNNTPNGETAQSVTVDGTVHVGGDFNIEEGADVTVSATGELNVGLNDSNGANAIIFGNQDGTGVDAVSRFILNGGTVNMGDGGARFDTGNSNGTPTASATNRKELTVNSGTLNINGALEISDPHVFFQMSGGSVNINPRGHTDYSSALDVFFLDRGTIDITGGTITIVNPHASTGIGELIHWNAVGDPSTGDFITVTNSSGWTLQLGDGSSSLAGSTEGFDLEIDATHTLPPITINNPSGTGRDINFNGNTRNYVMDGALTITAGTLDLESSSIDLNNTATGGFTLGNGAELIIGGTGDHFPGSSTESPSAGTPANFDSYTINSGSRVTYNGTTQTVDVPGGANTFGDLAISGSATKTLANAESVADSLLLQAGIFSASTNLTMGTGSTVVRSGGAFNTGDDIQGSNNYSISYTGTSQTSASEEFSGSGTFTAVTMNLNSGQTLTWHGAETVQDLNLLEGTLADAGAIITVNGNITNTAAHSGAGSILLTGGASAHTISGDSGGGTFSNLTLNDANGASISTDLTINGTLTLTAGVFDMGLDQISFSSSGTVTGSFSSSSMIQFDGIPSEDGLTKTFSSTNSGSPLTLPIGVGGKYTPVDIELTAATGLGDLTIKPIDDFTATTDPSNLEISYFWRLSSTISNPTVTLDFTYDQTDVPGTANELAFIPARLSGANWDDIQDVSQVDETNNIVTFSNVDYITGDFTTAEPSEFGVVVSYYSIADGNWTDASSWSTDGFGGSAGATIPSNGQVVFIGNNRTITANTNNLSAFSVEIQSTGTLLIADGTTGHSFGTVSGTGTLDIVSNSATTPEFPGGTFNDFLSASGGTVNYSGSGSYTLPTQATYNNVSTSGSGSRTLPDADLTLNGNFSPGHNGTASFSDATNGNLTIGGNIAVQDGTTTTLQFPGNTARTVAVTGDVTVAANAILDVINSGSVTHSLSIGGSLTNSGTFDMNTGGSLVDVTFTGASNNSVSGSGSTFEFNRLIVNKGTSQSNTLTLSSNNIVITSSAGLDTKPIELQNGTLQIDNNLGTFDLTSDGSTAATQAFSIPATSGLTLNNASTTLQVTSDVGADVEGGNILLAGALTIMDGAIIIGNDATGVTDNELLYSGTAGRFNISGGSITISGGFRVDRLNQSDSEINSTVIDYDQTGGTVTTTRYRFVRDGRNSTNNNNDFDVGTTVSGSDEAGFEIVNASSFDMTTGTITSVHGGASGGNDEGIPFLIGPSVTGSITGGTVQILNGNTATAVDINLGFASGLPLWNLNIGDGTTFIGEIGGVDGQQMDLEVQNDFVMNLPSGEFGLYDQSNGEDAENFMFTIGNDFTITAGTFESGLDDTDADENDLIFNGTNHNITFTPADVLIHDITFNHSGTATINNNVNINGEWTYNSGTVSLGSNTVTFHENFNSVNVATENLQISGSAFTFPNLTYEGDAGTVDLIINSDVTVSNTLTINSGIVNTTTRTLDVSTLTVDGTSFIETSGNESDGGIVRTFTTPSSEMFTYPLGINGVRRDVVVTATDAGTGTINIIPVASQNSFVSSGDALGIYWVITPQSFTSPTLSYTFNYIDPADVNGTETDYAAATFDGANFTIENGAGDSFDDVGNTFTIRNDNNGSSLQFLAGDDPDGFPPIETYYSLSSVCATGCDWNSASSWSTVSHAGAVASTAPAANNPVIIAVGDSLTIFGAGAVSATTQINGVVHTREIDNSGLGTVSGAGTLYMDRNDDTNVDQGGGNELVLPTLTGGTGTVHYLYTNGSNNFDVELPASPSTYHNLILGVLNDGSNNPDFEIANVAYTITGDMTVNDGQIDVENNGATITSDGSGTFTLRGGADMNVLAVNNFPSNFSSYDLINTGSLVAYTANAEQTIVTTANGGGTIAYGDVDLEDDNHVFTGTFDVNGLLRFDNGGAGISLGSGTLRVGGNLDFDGQNSISDSGDPVINAQTGTVIFDGGAAQSIVNVGGYTSSDTVDFNNLTIEGASTVVTFPSLSGVYEASGTLTFSNDATLDLTSQDLVLGGDYTNNSSNVTPFTTIDELILNGTTGDQNINGSSNVTLANLTLQKASGTNLNIGTPVTITSTLLMQNDGNIVMNSATDHDLIIATSASLTDGNSNNSFSVNRQITYDGARTGNSELILTGNGSTADSYDFFFPVGTSSGHSPVQFDVSAINNGGSNSTMTVRPVTGNASSVTIGGGTITNFDNTLATDRYVILDIGSFTDVTGTFTFSYVDADINGDESDYITRLWPGSGTTFEIPQTSGAVATSSNTQALNQYGGSAGTFIDDATTEWITGTNASFTPPLFSNGSGAWDVSTTWNTASDGSGSAGVPSATTNVTIEDSDIITMPNNAGTAILANTVQIGGSATIDFRLPYDQVNSTLSDVDGTGTIILDESPGLPATIDASDFFGSSGGTVNYDYSSDATERSLPSTISQYNNLTITDDVATDDATLQVNTTVLGNLLVDGAILNTGTSTLEVRGTITTQNSGALDPSIGTLNLAGSSAQAVPSVVSTYNNLIFSNVGSKTIGGITVNDLTIFLGTGTVDGGTNTITITGNWAGTTAFTQNGVGNVLFNAASGDQDISGTSSFHNIVVNKAADNVTLSGDISVSADVTLNSGTINSGSQSITFTGTAATQGFLGSSSITLNDLIINKSGGTDFQYNSQVSSIGGNLTLTSGDFVSTGPTSLTVGGNFTLESGATFNQSGTTITSMSIGGNYTDNGGGITLPSTISFDGSTAQTISTSLAFTNLTIDNTAGVSTNASQSVSGTLTITNGVLDLDQDDGNRADDPVLTLDPGTAVVGTFSDANHIEGKIATSTTFNSAYVFPVGDAGNYRGITLNPDNLSSFSTVQHIEETPPGTMPTDLTPTYETTLNSRYWDVTRGSGTGNVTVTVQLNTVEDGLSGSDLSSLALVRQNGGTWEAFATPNSANNPGAATLTGITTGFSPVGVASTSASVNPLPVELVYFRGVADNNEIHLDWATVSEVNNDYFEVLRSGDGIEFEVLGTVDGNGFSSELRDYGFIDSDPYLGANYYRLRQVDFNGDSELHNIIRVRNDYVMNGIVASTYPNPTSVSNLNLRIVSGDDHSPIGVRIVDLLGKTYFEISIEAALITNQKLSLAEGLKSGVYFLVVEQAGLVGRHKIVIE